MLDFDGRFFITEKSAEHSKLGVTAAFNQNYQGVAYINALHTLLDNPPQSPAEQGYASHNHPRSS
jgi:hypothetical protein